MSEVSGTCLALEYCYWLVLIGDTKLLPANTLETWESSYFGKVSAERAAGYAECCLWPEAAMPAWVQKCMATSADMAGLWVAPGMVTYSVYKYFHHPVFPSYPLLPSTFYCWIFLFLPSNKCPLWHTLKNASLLCFCDKKVSENWHFNLIPSHRDSVKFSSAENHTYYTAIIPTIFWDLLPKCNSDSQDQNINIAVL